MYYASLALAVLSVVGYHATMKRVPSTLNPFLPLAAAYLLAFLICLLGLWLWPHGEKSWSALKPGVLAIALAVVGIELGFLLAYRAGVNVGSAALAVNVCSALVLIPLGLWLFKEHLTPAKLAGVALSLGGLALLLKK